MNYDLILPGLKQSDTLLVCLHGGGWISGSKKDYFDRASCLAAAFSMPAVNLDYPLGVPLEKILAQLADDVNRAAENIRALGFKPEKVAFCGFSAGAHLALAMALGKAGRLTLRVSFALGESTPAALWDGEKQKYPHFAARCISSLAGTKIRAGEFKEHEQRIKEISIFSLCERADVPLFLFHGENDGLAPLGGVKEFADFYKSKGGKVFLLCVPGESHELSGCEELRNNFLQQIIKTLDIDK